MLSMKARSLAAGVYPPADHPMVPAAACTTRPASHGAPSYPGPGRPSSAPARTRQLCITGLRHRAGHPGCHRLHQPLRGAGPRCGRRDRPRRWRHYGPVPAGSAGGGALVAIAEQPLGRNGGRHGAPGSVLRHQARRRRAARAGNSDRQAAGAPMVSAVFELGILPDALSGPAGSPGSRQGGHHVACTAGH